MGNCISGNTDSSIASDLLILTEAAEENRKTARNLEVVSCFGEANALYIAKVALAAQSNNNNLDRLNDRLVRVEFMLRNVMLIQGTDLVDAPVTELEREVAYVEEE
mmetsp:Transcript_53096/g.60150  ORF Transcript_53096/g.60150 Transcript_53096/m.60150 type:complete len:106 (+) Transcript_53096:154-471(+)